MWTVYAFRYFALMLHAAFGFFVVHLFMAAIERFDWLVISTLIVIFALNALSPYYSSKTEFSLAMFSNLRPDRWSHFIFREPSRQTSKKEYVEILKMHGMPEPTLFSRASMNYRLLRSFSPFENRKYLKYYIVESIMSLSQELDSDFTIELTDGQNNFQISSVSDISELKHQKLCLMPAVLPKNANTPYCN